MALDPSISNAWTRFLHRTDMTGDYTLVESLARQRIGNRLMQVIDPVDVDALQTEQPAIWIYAGLIELQNIAQDADQLEAAAAQFENAAADYIMQHSIDEGTPAMVKTDYQ